ncbi:hypothetical protein PAXRUDRAFT_22508 [Paxillus rubicundulus Ve08.2h10]|uniref:Uncharacterized protein n=1 Tax=Paxillus rubicundulus Ve08.2h10 TaxID=930991 RepID=A0A0D0D5B3_9AGAM|nr:hypothetical protein PAXRUDRAFT_22508 [Paxillus rubicundulus Ve08.2h10]
MPPLSPGKGGLQSILVDQATSGAVEGSNPSPGTSKGSIPRPFQRPNLSIRSGDIKAASYPLKAGPNFGCPKGKIWPSSDPMDQIIKGLEVRVASLKKQVERIPDLELQLSSMAWVVEALWEQVTPPASVGLSPDAETPFGNGKFPSETRFPHIGG